MTRAISTLLTEGLEPFTNPNPPIPPVSGCPSSDRPSPPRGIQDGAVSCSNSSAPDHNKRYDFEFRMRQDAETNTSSWSTSNFEFTELTKLIYKVIKLCHHLSCVASDDEVDVRIPSFIQRTTHLLCATIRPALPDQAVRTGIENNAKAWRDSTLRVLEQHDSSLLANTLQDVALLLPRFWSAQFAVATRWAKKKFLRLRQSTLDEAKQLISSYLPFPPATTDPSTLPATSAPPLSTSDVITFWKKHRSPPASRPPVGFGEKNPVPLYLRDAGQLALPDSGCAGASCDFNDDDDYDDDDDDDDDEPEDFP